MRGYQELAHPGIQQTRRKELRCLWYNIAGGGNEVPFQYIGMRHTGVARASCNTHIRMACTYLLKILRLTVHTARIGRSLKIVPVIGVGLRTTQPCGSRLGPLILEPRRYANCLNRLGGPGCMEGTYAITVPTLLRPLLSCPRGCPVEVRLTCYLNEICLDGRARTNRIARSLSCCVLRMLVVEKMFVIQLCP